LIGRRINEVIIRDEVKEKSVRGSSLADGPQASALPMEKFKSPPIIITGDFITDFVINLPKRFPALTRPIDIY
jgi:hypothetical protein